MPELSTYHCDLGLYFVLPHLAPVAWKIAFRGQWLSGKTYTCFVWGQVLRWAGSSTWEQQAKGFALQQFLVTQQTTELTTKMTYIDVSSWPIVAFCQCFSWLLDINFLWDSNDYDNCLLCLDGTILVGEQAWALPLTMLWLHMNLSPFLSWTMGSET